NRSATRGRPPVMSRVLEDSCGMRAMTSPTDTFAPSSRLTSAPGGSVYTAGISVLAKVTSLPLVLTSLIVARKSLPPRCFISSTTVLERPVTSSSCEVTVSPSTKSWNFTSPAPSVMTGSVGSSADVEGAHRELRAGLADRLRGDDANGLADADEPAARQIAPVALSAHAVARLTRDRRAHVDLVHALVLEPADELLIEQRR